MNKLINNKIFITILTVLCALIFISSILYIAYFFYSSHAQNRINGNARDMYNALEPLTEPTTESAAPPMADTLIASSEITADRAQSAVSETEADATAPALPANYERFSPFLEINKDFVAYLLIPGLDIEEPVVQYKDNDYYLDINFQGEKAKHGAVFLDAGNNADFSGVNNILYGHNMNDGTMFRGLLKYKSLSAYAKAPVIQIESLYGYSTWLIFAVYNCEPEFNYFHTRYSAEGFSALIDEIQSRSLIRTDIDVNADDSLLTLSTCDYIFEDARFVVQARLLREGEALPEKFNAKTNTARAAFNVPNQQMLSEVQVNGLTALQHPLNTYHYFFQTRENGIDRYAGSFAYVQGPYPAFEGDINKQYASWVAAGCGHPAKAEFYLVSGGLRGETPGLFLLTSDDITGPYTLASEKPVTPEGINAKWPALYTDNEGEITLLYTVTDVQLGTETLYAARLDGGSAEIIRKAPFGTDIRPVDIIERGNSGVFLLWKEGNRLLARMKTDEGFKRDVNVNYREQEGRLQIVYQRVQNRWVAMVELDGEINTRGINIDNLLNIKD